MKYCSTELPHVLLVESDDLRAMQFQRLFSSAAFHWGQIRLKDGAAAIQHMIFQGFPDLLVTRLETPKLDAVDLAEWLCNIKCPKPVEVMVYDTLDSDLNERLYQCGVRDFIDRGMPEEKLKTILRQKALQIESNFIPQQHISDKGHRSGKLDRVKRTQLESRHSPKHFA